MGFLSCHGDWNLILEIVVTRYLLQIFSGRQTNLQHLMDSDQLELCGFYLLFLSVIQEFLLSLGYVKTLLLYIFIIFYRD